VTVGDITYSAVEQGDVDLPDFVIFDENSLTFTFDTVQNVFEGTYTIEITATEDLHGTVNSAETFDLVVSAYPVVLDAPSDVGDL
jgi:hypothetical protein